MIKEKKGKFSKRINYSVIENMFASEFPKGKRTKKAAAVVHAEEKDEEEKGDEVEDDVLQPDGAENDFSNQYYDNFEGDGYQEEVWALVYCVSCSYSSLYLESESTMNIL